MLAAVAALALAAAAAARPARVFAAADFAAALAATRTYFLQAEEVVWNCERFFPFFPFFSLFFRRL
jgi:hypothetical protein